MQVYLYETSRSIPVVSNEIEFYCATLCEFGYTLYFLFHILNLHLLRKRKLVEDRKKELNGIKCSPENQYRKRATSLSLSLSLIPFSIKEIRPRIHILECMTMRLDSLMFMRMI